MTPVPLHKEPFIYEPADVTIEDIRKRPFDFKNLAALLDEMGNVTEAATLRNRIDAIKSRR